MLGLFGGAGVLGPGLCWLYVHSHWWSNIYFALKGNLKPKKFVAHPSNYGLSHIEVSSAWSDPAPQSAGQQWAHQSNYFMVASNHEQLTSQSIFHPTIQASAVSKTNSSNFRNPPGL